MPQMKTPQEWRDFAAIPGEILNDERLDVYEKMLVGAVLYHAWSGHKTFPGQDTLARLMGCSKRQVMRATQSLEAHGYLAVSRALGKPNEYDFRSLAQKKAPAGVPNSHGSPPAAAVNTRTPVTSSHPPRDPQSPVPVPSSHPTGDGQSHPPVTDSHPNDITAISQSQIPAGAEALGFTKRHFEKWWSESYQKAFGTNFIFTARDAKAAKTLVAQMPLDILKAKVTAAWQSSNRFVAGRSQAGIYGFAEVVNQVGTSPGLTPEELRGYAHG